MKDIQFNEDLFFELILPLILFPTGFNMKRRKFFKNIGTIIKFGFIGTFICFILYTCMIYGLLQSGFLTKYDHVSNKYIKIEYGMYEILILCSLLCSSDVIAAVSMIDYS